MIWNNGWHIDNSLDIPEKVGCRAVIHIKAKICRGHLRMARILGSLKEKLNLWDSQWIINGENNCFLTGGSRHLLSGQLVLLLVEIYKTLFLKQVFRKIVSNVNTLSSIYGRFQFKRMNKFLDSIVFDSHNFRLSLSRLAYQTSWSLENNKNRL